MALIGKIRSHMWIVFVIIALALASFVLMDAQGPGGGVVNNTTLGVVNGRKIDYREFDQTERVLFTNSSQNPLMRRAGLWDYFVTKTLVEGESSEIGLNVGKNELTELQFGQNISPIIFQNFRNPQTGQIDFEQLQQIRQAIDNNTLPPATRQYWAEQEKQVITTQLQTKLNTLVQKGIYTPGWFAEEAFKNEKGTIDIEVVKIPFDDIPALDITLTDSDFNAYMNKRKSEYERKEEARVVEYVAIDVFPNAIDTATWREEIEELISEFRSTENDSLFAATNKGVLQNYYAKAEEIQEIIRGVVPSMKIGGIYGPYISQRNFQAVKLVDRKLIPDSVSASHILIRAEQGNITQSDNAHSIIDSLMDDYNNGADFAEMAREMSEDLTNKADGGDLGYFVQGIMVPSFNEVCFISGRTGRVYKVITQFGIHLLKINNRVFNSRNPKYKLGYVNVPVIPTKETQDAHYENMVDLVGSYSYLDGLRQKTEETANIEIATSNNLGENDYSIDLLGPGNTTRDIVKFAYNQNTEVSDLSPEIFTYTDPALYYNTKYVITGLSKILKPGMPDVDDVRDDIEFAVLNQKKAERYLTTLQGKSFDQIASDTGIEIDTVLNASLNSVFVAGIGNEPLVMGTAYKLADGESCDPLVGESGVFIVRKISSKNPSEATGLVSVKSRISNQDKGAKNFKLMEAIREKAKIKDNRSIFF